MSALKASRKPLATRLAEPRGCKRCVFASCLVWLLCFQVPPLNYAGQAVGQIRPHGERPLRTTMLVRERRGSLWRKKSDSKLSGGGKSRSFSSSTGGEKAIKDLTRRITRASTAAELLDVLNEAVYFPDFNYFHISAAYHTLAKFHRKGLLQGLCESPVLPKLHTRVNAIIMSQQINPQASANVLWAMAVLFDAIPGTTQLLPALIKVFPEKAPGMDEQELSNCFWASAQLKDVSPDVLKVVPALAARIQSKAGDMIPQHLSNCLWASAQLKDVAPEMLKAVPALIAQIPGKAGDMIPQHLSNCLWASAHLKDVAPEVLKAVPALIAQISGKAGDMIPQHLSNCLWASAQLKDVAPEVLKAVPALIAQIPGKAGDMIPQELSNCLWASAQLKDVAPQVLKVVPALIAEVQGKTKQMNTLDFSQCSWAFQN